MACTTATVGTTAQDPLSQRAVVPYKAEGAIRCEAFHELWRLSMLVSFLSGVPGPEPGCSSSKVREFDSSTRSL